MSNHRSRILSFVASVPPALMLFMLITPGLWTNAFVGAFRTKLQCKMNINRLFLHQGLNFRNNIPGTVPSVAGDRISRRYSKLKSSTSQVEDDGYTTRYGLRPGFINKIMKLITDFFQKLFGKIFQPRDPGTLILVRHGESTWNYNSTFTGWVDVDLSERGRREMEHAARLLLERGYSIDVAYTSRLKRAIRSMWILLRELHQIYRPVYKSYRLNERMYGALEGMSKPQLAREIGKEAVINYRTDMYAMPPPMDPTHPHWHLNERKYTDLDPKEIPLTESLQDSMSRSLPLLESRILPDLQRGNNVLVVAHGNSLRGIVKHIDNLNATQIKSVGIPNGIPLVYKFDKNMSPIRLNRDESPLSGTFLEKKGLLREALAHEAELAKMIPGYDLFEANMTGFEKVLRYSPPLDPMLAGLAKLDNERKLLSLISQTSSESTGDLPPDSGSSSPATATEGDAITMITSSRKTAAVTTEKSISRQIAVMPRRVLPSAAFAVSPLISRIPVNMSAVTTYKGSSSVKAETDTGFFRSITSKITSLNPIKQKRFAEMPVPPPANPYIRDDGTARSLQSPVIVIIRHGKTEHNKLGLFTGWEDAPLAAEGRQEAQKAGRVLRMHGLTFDVVYTSWLSRAIETAWLVLNELDLLWLPIIKSWRLNERMYGALTGLSKKMIGERHGEKQLKIWRRSYDRRPPKVSSFSHHYPGNDERYVKYVRDVPISPFESVVRSLADGKLGLHRAFPKTESLRDCMERTIPYFRDTIYPGSIAKGKNVLIASSENAIRGLLMHLCEIPTDRIHELEIPTGLPLVFDVHRKCIKLLDDGSGENPLVKYNFGTSPDLLFRPCDLREEDYITIDTTNDATDSDSDKEAKGSGAAAAQKRLKDDVRVVSKDGHECYLGADGRLLAYDPIIRLREVFSTAAGEDVDEAEGDAFFTQPPITDFPEFDKSHSADSALL